MAEEAPDRPPVKPVLAALDVERNAKIGFGSGVVLALLAYWFRVGEVLGPVPDTRGSPGLFLVLAFVLAVSAGGLITLVLTVRTAIGLARQTE